MAISLKMQPDEMRTNCSDLGTIAEELLDKKNDLVNKAYTLCDNWESDSSPVYREDFETIGKQIDSISELVTSLTTSIENYITDMEQVDASYAKR